MNYNIYSHSEKANYHHKNQDCYLISEYSFMGNEKILNMIVCDGMGGLDDGDKASRNAVEGYLSSLYQEMLNICMEIFRKKSIFPLVTKKEVFENAMRKAVEHANQYVIEKSGPYIETGTTLSAACVVENSAVVINVGDSPVYCYRKETDTLELVSRLQTKAEQDVEKGKYERYSEDYYENEHIIYNCLGQYNEIDNIASCYIENLKPGDKIIMGSDGAFGRRKTEQIEELVGRVSKENEPFVLKKLFELAREDKEDDQTAIMLIVNE